MTDILVRVLVVHGPPSRLLAAPDAPHEPLEVGAASVNVHPLPRRLPSFLR